MNSKILLIPLIVLLVVLSGCSVQSHANSSTQTKIENKSKSIEVAVATNNDVPNNEATSSENVIKNGITWKLTNGKSISPRSSDFITNLNFGNIGVVSVKVPEVTKPTYYFFITKKNSYWAINGVIGAQLYDNKNNKLPNAYSELDQTSIAINKLGHFTELYNKKTFITIGNVNAVVMPLPKGKNTQLNSGQAAILFQENNINGIYYSLGSNWVFIAGNIDSKSIINLANDTSLDVFTNP